MRSPVPVLAALALAAGCARPPPPATGSPRAPAAPTRYGLAEAPRELAPAIARAEAAIEALRGRLAARLAAEISASGASGAVRVCREEAPALAAEVLAQTGVEVGRTGARLRNPVSAPRPWAAAEVEASRERRAAEVAPVVLDLGDRVGLLRPIAVGPSCLACHGGPDRVVPAVRATLEAAYPSDRATGFTEGDLGGFFWAEARK